MASRLIAKPLKLEEIAIYYKDSEAALRFYFSDKNPKFEEIFTLDSREEISSKLNDRIEELARSTSLSLLAVIEATIMMDCKERDKNNKNDNLSIALIPFVKNQKYILLKDEILDIWKSYFPRNSQLIGDLKGALKYRHWLAHGRHFTPKMGRPDYDYPTIYQLTENILNSFPFEGI